MPRRQLAHSAQSKKVTLESFGPTSQAAIRLLLTEFRNRGWSDSSNAALEIVRAIEHSHGLSLQRAARAAPPDFLSVNDLRRQDVVDLLLNLVRQRRPADHARD